MACATLKRSLDWESLSAALPLPSKRRRCLPYSPACPAAPCASPAPSPSPARHDPSPFANSAQLQHAKLTPERMAQEICDEIKRLQRRKQLRLAEVGPAAASSSSSGSEGDASPPHHSHLSNNSNKVHNRALFTFKQVRIICERMLREQEAALRAEYEAALSGKLAEQYEAFVRFNLDQIQRRPPPGGVLPHSMDADQHHMHQDLVPSYLS